MNISIKHSLTVLNVLLVLTPSLLRSTGYRVSTPAQITAAMSTALPGDTLTMTNGTWMNAAIMFAGFGAQGAPILLRSESYGGVILTGTSTLRISGRHLVVDGLLFRNGYSPSGAVIEFQGTNGESDSCRLTNSTIQEYNPSNLTIDYKWVSLYGTYNRVDHCYIRGKTHQGSTLVVWVDPVRSNYHQIDHNYFAPRPPLPNNGGETIRVGTGVVSETNGYTVVEFNYFERCNGDAEYISNKSGGNIYRYNTFVSCEGTLSMRQGSRATIEGNFIFGNHVSGTGGIRLMGTDHQVYNNYVCGVTGDKAGCALSMMDGTPPGVTPNYDQVKRAVVVFNTFVDDNYPIGLGVTGSGRILPSDSCTIANNVVYATSSPAMVTLYDTPTHLTWQGNIFYGSPLGIPPTPGITIVNPLMAIAADGLWRPGPTSPVINASADSFAYVIADMDGQPRDAFPDVGADELSLAPITRRPLTPADVGPPPGMITAVVEQQGQENTMAHEIVVEQNYPNPFNPSTTIRYALSHGASVTLAVFNILGQQVAQLVNEQQQAGYHDVVFRGDGLVSGVYFYRFEAGPPESDGRRRAGDFVASGKLLLLK